MSAIVWYWLMIASIAAAGAAYVLAIWWQVRGVRGAALGTALVCLFLIVSCFAGLHSDRSLIPLRWLAAMERAAWWPMLFALLVVVDLYAADHNGHRAITTILYLRWERLRNKRG